MSATALRIVEGSSMDKTKALSAALSQIERQFGKGLGDAAGQERSLDGYRDHFLRLAGARHRARRRRPARGRVVEIYGPESSGKTTLALHTVAEGQKRAASAPSSTPSMRSTRSMPESSASTSTSS